MSDLRHEAPESPALSATRIEEIEARANAATEGPWERVEPDTNYDQHRVGGTVVTPTDAGFLRTRVLAEANRYYKNHDTDADFIAHARQDIPDLLAEVRRLQGENARIAEERETYRRAWNRSDALLASAREETAQAVRAERDACAKIVDAQSQRERGWGNDDAANVLHDMRNLILARSMLAAGGRHG